MTAQLRLEPGTAQPKDKSFIIISATVPEVIKRFSCSSQLSMKFKLLIITEITKIG